MVLIVLHPNSGVISMKIRTIKTIKISDFNCELNSGHHLNALLCALCFGGQIMHSCTIFIESRCVVWIRQIIDIMLGIL